MTTNKAKASSGGDNGRGQEKEDVAQPDLFEEKIDDGANPFEDLSEDGGKSPPLEELDVDEYIKKHPKAAERLQKLEQETKEKEDKLIKTEEDNRLMREYFAEMADKQRKQEEQKSAGDKQSPEDIKRELRENWHKDPVEAMEKIASLKMQPIVESYVADRAESSTKEIQAHPKYKQYEADFQAVWQTLPVSNRTPKMARFIYDNVRVRDLDKREMEFEKKTKLPEQPPYTEKPSGEAQTLEPLSPRERKMMEAFGMSEDQWREAAKASRHNVI